MHLSETTISPKFARRANGPTSVLYRTFLLLLAVYRFTAEFNSPIPLSRIHVMITLTIMVSLLDISLLTSLDKPYYVIHVDIYITTNSVNMILLVSYSACCNMIMRLRQLECRHVMKMCMTLYGYSSVGIVTGNAAGEPPPLVQIKTDSNYRNHSKEIQIDFYLNTILFQYFIYLCFHSNK